MKKILNIIITTLAALILLMGTYSLIGICNILKFKSIHPIITMSGTKSSLIDAQPIQETLESPSHMGTEESTEDTACLPELSSTQVEILESLSSKMAAGDRIAAAEILRHWKLMLEENSDGTTRTLQGYSFDGTTIHKHYTGTALASDNANRFYYGVLTDGVPNGAGYYLVLHNNQLEKTTYLWISGTWDHGILTNNFHLFIDEVPLDQPSAMRNRLEMIGVTDGSEQERFLSAHVTQYTIQTQWDQTSPISTPIHEFQVQYDIQNGKLIEAQWTFKDHRYLRACTEVVDGITAFMGVTDCSKSQFQNPYPWNKEYRFVYNPLFGTYPDIMEWNF